MNYFSKEDAINVLSETLNITFSNEQTEVMQADLKRPMLVDAIAGSGKTTTFMIRTLYLIITGQLKPRQILGITFSKKSQLDMKEKYINMVKKLLTNEKILNNKNILIELQSSKPVFSTFHALFFGLLRVCNFHGKLELLVDKEKLNRLINKQVDNKSDPGSKIAIIKSIFDLKEKLTNLNYCTNGLDISIDKNSYSEPESYEDFSDKLDAILEKETNLSVSNGRKLNYYKVIYVYNKYKDDKHFIDFNDMKSLLLKDINNNNMLNAYRAKMMNCKLVVLDEFQDIDNIQWKIITSLLSKSGLNSLTAIGDDDQSIYSFRGSNPTYILNYNKYMKTKTHLNSQIKTLSTNYRTGGSILQSVVPMIEKNTLRLAKSINAFSKNKQSGSIYVSNDIDEYVDSIIRDVKNPNLSYADVAVVNRYNDSKKLLSDRLADKGLFINLKRSLVLQNDPVYSSFMNVIRCFFFDDATKFVEVARYIGFGKYEHFVKNIFEKTPNFETDTQYLFEKLRMEIAQNHDDKLISFTNKAENFYQKIHSIRESFDKVNDKDAKIKLIGNLVDAVDETTENYFDYMTSNRFVSLDSINRINEYIQKAMIDYWKNEEDIYMSLKQDHDKLLIMNDSNLIKKKNNENNIKEDITFLSVHQSKGLEFKNVYLYDSNSKEISFSLFKISYFFNLTDSLKLFKQTIINLPKKEIKELERVYIDNKLKFSAYDDLAKEVDINRFKYQAFNPRYDPEKNSFGSRISFLQKVVEFLQYGDSSSHIFKQFNKFIVILYNQTMNELKQIEEERRLLYVAITRAKENLFLDLPVDPIPILLELNLHGSKLISQNNETIMSNLLLEKWKNQVKISNKELEEKVKILEPILVQTKK
ncbi:UvrD-helicase domain-containing protein [Apilactobacillus timberlakei]|uniref:UvrD-helicase domain-containing protein n=1 Tax=Apilactobacillus timberlakei TaxID=2008380 RepID=UPI001125C42C|nr:ATP-dependent helicase [Apilactobacillus timberlakei]TPR21511.1 hypothetical protein DY083_05690 [Apilactobacillus timberlakei]